MHDMHMRRAACFGRARARDEHLSETEALRDTKICMTCYKAHKQWPSTPPVWGAQCFTDQVTPYALYDKLKTSRRYLYVHL